MEGDSLSRRKAQLDKAEREQLEDVVENLCERVEDNVTPPADAEVVPKTVDDQVL